MNAACRKYLFEVKSFFPIMGRSERRYLANLTRDIEDYCETEHVSSLSELYTAFGKPQTVIAAYLETADTAWIVKKIQLTKWLRRGLACLLMLAFICASVYAVITYDAYQTFKKEQIFFQEDTIE